MPVTPFQRKIMRLIAANRSPESHVAGGLVINRHERSYRTSDVPGVFYYDDKGPVWGERLFAAPDKFTRLPPTLGGAWPAILPPP